MNCKRCGKALGTDRGICPFCGAPLSQEQMQTFQKWKKEEQYKEKMITEKYNGKKVYFEKRENNDSLAFLLIILGLMVLIIMVILIIILSI